MLLMKKGILGCNIIYLFILICIGIALPIKSQNNYKVKLTGTVYEYDHNNKRLPLEFAAVSIPEIGLSLKPWGIALKFLFLHHENILFPND